MNNIPMSPDFVQAAMNAWNSLSILIEPEEKSLFENETEFKHFYTKVMERLLTDEAEE